MVFSYDCFMFEQCSCFNSQVLQCNTFATLCITVLCHIFRLNVLLDGGLYTSEVTEVYGSSGVGKTQVSVKGKCILIYMVLFVTFSTLV